MSESALPELIRENPTFFEAGGERLFGILSQPQQPSPVREALAVIVVPGGGGTRLSTNRNRWSVRLCRRLAARGFHAFRFDLRGGGESTGVEEPLDLAHPYEEDVTGAVEWLRGQGHDRFVLVGSCFGARTALSCAPKIPGLSGLVLVSAPLRDYAEGETRVSRVGRNWNLRRILARAIRPHVILGLLNHQRRRAYSMLLKAKWSHWRRSPAGEESTQQAPSKHFLEPFEGLVRERIPVLFIYSEGDSAHEEFKEAAASKTLGAALFKANSLIHVALVPGRVHGFRDLVSQDAALQEIQDWAMATFRDGEKARHLRESTRELKHEERNRA